MNFVSNNILNRNSRIRILKFLTVQQKNFLTNILVVHVWVSYACTRRRFVSLFPLTLFKDKYFPRYYIHYKSTSNQVLWACFKNLRYGGWMEAESHNWSHFFVNLWLAELALRVGPNIELKCHVCAGIWCFWPLTASTNSDVKNDCAHVIMQGICNKFMEIKFSVRCMVCPWLLLLHHQHQ